MNKLELIKKDLACLPCFVIGSEGNDWIYGSCRNFNVRVLPQTVKGYRVQFGVKKTFDRWANSCNFAFDVDYRGKWTQDFSKTYSWMMRVVRSGVFDFNSYFSTIECAWFPRAIS